MDFLLIVSAAELSQGRECKKGGILARSGNCRVPPGNPDGLIGFHPIRTRYSTLPVRTYLQKEEICKR
jgi:hypothetical protein